MAPLTEYLPTTHRVVQLKTELVMTVILMIKRWKQKDQKFSVILRYLVGLRPV